MKLYRVLLLIFCSGILFVGVVSDISAAGFQRDGPYEASVDARRFGGNENRLHVNLYARASSTDRARNGYLSIYLKITNGWSANPAVTPVDSHVWLWDHRDFQFEENGGYVSAYASGQDTGRTLYTAFVDESVGPMPPPDPPPATNPTNPEPQLGISPVDPDDTPYPGEAHEYRLITDAPYYYVYWYVKAPWETSERGSYIGSDSGDGTTTEATFSYTFPSGAMHTGDFLITAVIYRWSDMSEYEETYTATVSLE